MRPALRVYPTRSKALPWNALPLWLCHNPKVDDQLEGDVASQ